MVANLHDTVRAFHPRTLGVIETGKVTGMRRVDGKAYFRVRFLHVVWRDQSSRIHQSAWIQSDDIVEILNTVPKYTERDAVYPFEYPTLPRFEGIK